MNDFSELENELRKLRQAQPASVLFERVGEALEKSRASAATDAKWKRWRFTEWRRRAASGIDGQLVRARERERTSQTPYNWWSLGFGLAGAAVLILFAVVAMERRHEQQASVVQSSTASETRAVPLGTERSISPSKFVPAGGTNVVYNTRDEGLHFRSGSERPVRRVRYRDRKSVV